MISLSFLCGSVWPNEERENDESVMSKIHVEAFKRIDCDLNLHTTEAEDMVAVTQLN